MKANGQQTRPEKSLWSDGLEWQNDNQLSWLLHYKFYNFELKRPKTSCYNPKSRNLYVDRCSDVKSIIPLDYERHSNDEILNVSWVPGIMNWNKLKFMKRLNECIIILRLVFSFNLPYPNLFLRTQQKLQWLSSLCVCW